MGSVGRRSEPLDFLPEALFTMRDLDEILYKWLTMDTAVASFQFRHSDDISKTLERQYQE